MISLIQGDALHIPLANETVQCVITSPPYYGLRDYGVSGQIGLEETPEAYIEKMVMVFREVWRVLRDDGTIFVNLGDSYAGSGKSAGGGGKGPASSKQLTNQGSYFETVKSKRDAKRWGGGNLPATNGLKPKDMIGIPWLLAFALRADGWYLRSDVIWHKPNPMPESVTDRPTKSHEYVFLLSKSQRYYYDQEAIREPQSDNPATLSRYEYKRSTGKKLSLNQDNNWQDSDLTYWPTGGRNRRTVWTIPTSPYKGSHFATFPPDLVEPCLLAGTSERGCCPSCGAPWERIGTSMIVPGGGGKPKKIYDTSNMAASMNNKPNFIPGYKEYTTTGWRSSCSCPPADPVPCTVLDPFAGTFTVGMVAIKHRRSAVGIELNPKYIELARKRCSDIQVVMPLSPAPGED